MKLLIKEHRNAGRIIPQGIQDEVKEAITTAPSLKKATVTRDNILNALRKRHGWSDEVILCSDTKISITGKKGETGLCIQTGNVSRFYADLLKLEYLFKKELVHGAIYILPDKALAKAWGQNIANFERFTNEVGIFSQIIHIPLFIIGIPKI